MQHSICKALAICFLSTISMFSAQSNKKLPRRSTYARQVQEVNPLRVAPPQSTYAQRDREVNPLRLAPPAAFNLEDHRFTVTNPDDATIALHFPQEVTVSCTRVSSLKVLIHAPKSPTDATNNHYPIISAFTGNPHAFIESTLKPQDGPSVLQVAARVLLNPKTSNPVAALCVFRQCPIHQPDQHRVTSIAVLYKNEVPLIKHVNGKALQACLATHARGTYERTTGSILIGLLRELEQQPMPQAESAPQ